MSNEYVKANEITLVIVEHNVERAKLADRCFKLERIKIIFQFLWKWKNEI